MILNESSLGLKFFKELEDGTIHLIRIIKVEKASILYMDKDNYVFTIKDEGNNNEYTITNPEELKDYTILEPDGILNLNIVAMTDNNNNHHKDIIITGTKFANIKYFHDMKPYCICRQCADDFYSELMGLSTDISQYAGLAVNQDDCPEGIDMGILLACDSIVDKDFINFYRLDTLDNILDFIDIKKYDNILKDLYAVHIKPYISTNTALAFANKHNGWCKSLRDLLIENNFQNDLDDMLNITSVDFNIDEHIIEKKITEESDKSYTSLDNEMTLWLSSIYKIGISNTFVLDFNHDINLSEFNNSRYFIFRDKSNKVYLIVYNLAGQFKPAELEEKAKELDFSSKFRLRWYDKYHQNNN